MPFIKFTQDRSTVEAEPQTFKVGRIYELSEASCERWKRRQAAEDATEAEFKAQGKARASAGEKAAAEKAEAERLAAEKAEAAKP